MLYTTLFWAWIKTRQKWDFAGRVATLFWAWIKTRQKWDFAGRVERCEQDATTHTGTG